MVRVTDGGLLGVRVVEGLDMTQIINLLSECDEPFEDSMLYSSGADAKFIDKSNRVSTFRALVDSKLFDATAAVLSQISAADESCDYTLVRSDVTQIVYKPGGFFKRHQDFLSLATNLVEEQTLLICITPTESALACEGGATTIHANGGKSVDFEATTTPGHALLFRKDREHEGQLVRAGEKHILSVNVWAHYKKSGQVLVVTFPETAATDANNTTADGTRADGNAALLAAANARVYAMSADDASGMLEQKVEWANRAADEEGTPRPPVITFECIDATYEEFGTVFRILSRMHISAAELTEHRATIDFFLPAMRLEDVLVDLATAPASEPSSSAVVLEPGRRVVIRTAPADRPALKDVEGVVCGLCAQTEDGPGCYPILPDGPDKEAVLLHPSALEPKFDDLAAAAKAAASKAIAIGGSEDQDVGETDAEVICCESEERTKVLVDLARSLDLPYVRFKMIFVALRCEGLQTPQCSAALLYMQPCSTLNSHPLTPASPTHVTG